MIFKYMMLAFVLVQLDCYIACFFLLFVSFAIEYEQLCFFLRFVCSWTATGYVLSARPLCQAAYITWGVSDSLATSWTRVALLCGRKHRQPNLEETGKRNKGK